MGWWHVISACLEVSVGSMPALRICADIPWWEVGEEFCFRYFVLFCQSCSELSNGCENREQHEKTDAQDKLFVSQLQWPGFFIGGSFQFFERVYVAVVNVELLLLWFNNQQIVGGAATGRKAWAFADAQGAECMSPGAGHADSGGGEGQKYHHT